jgi:hypothetical protein
VQWSISRLLLRRCGARTRASHVPTLGDALPCVRKSANVARTSARAMALLIFASLAHAGPVEFGLAELNAALASRNLKWKAKTELSLDPPETYRIEPYTAGGVHITGGDLRGLMYGLLEAADQVRATGKLTPSRGVPATAMRGIRIFVRGADLEAPWYSTEDFWRSYFQMLARDRFNHFNLIFVSPHLAPPYPYFLAVDDFTGVRIPGLTADRRERNLRMLRFISQTAAEFGVDFILGIREQGVDSPVEGVTRFNLGRYTHDALRKLLTACPMIRGLQVQPDFEAGTNSDRQIAFYRDSVFKALHEAGHRVTLDPLGLLRQPGLLTAADQAGVALRLSSVPWPGGFEIDPPLDPGHWAADLHPLFYWLWGQLSYDPKTKPLKGEKIEDYRAANQAIHMLAAAHLSDPNMYTWPPANPGGWTEEAQEDRSSDWGFVASIRDAVRHRLHHIASAQQTPLETADLLNASAENLEKASAADFQLLARLARYHAHKQRAAYDLELFDQTKDGASLDRAEKELKSSLALWDSPDASVGLNQVALRRKDREPGPAVEIPALEKPLPRPQISRTLVKNALPDQPVTLTLQITPPKDVVAVHLHYRTTNPTVPAKVIEKPAEASMSFTIPGPDIAVNWDLLYYFEILNRDNHGWFEPDPLAGAYYDLVTIAAPPPP